MSPNEPAPASDPSGEPQKRPARRWPWIVGGAFLALVGFVALLPALLSTAWTGELIQGWMRENLETPAEFDDLEVGWTDGITLRGLRVADKDGLDGEPLLESPLVRLDAPLFPLLMKRLEVDLLVIEQPVLRVNVDEDPSKADVVKRKRIRRKPDAERSEGEAEPTVLPALQVPVKVNDLTLILVDAEGNEARETGVDFDGNVTTRDGPIDFNLSIPGTTGDDVSVKGEATLFSPTGELLPARDRVVEANVTLGGIVAEDRAELLRLFLPELQLAGTVSGNLELENRGSRTQAAVDLALTGAAMGEAVDGRDRAAKNLSVTGSIVRDGDRVELDALRVRADGVELDADLAGKLPQLVGKVRADVDFGRLTDALLQLGVQLDGRMAGKLVGEAVFQESPARGDGEFVLSGFSTSGLIEGRPPVELERGVISFRVAPAEDRLVIESSRIEFPELTVTATGHRGSDGSFDSELVAAGDLGRVLARVRDLGFLPPSFALAGSIDGRVRATAGPDGAPLTVEVPSFTLTSGATSLRASGRRADDGRLSFEVTGSGALGELLGNLEGAAADLGALRTNFAVEARGDGTADSLTIEVPTLKLSGDVNLDASARVTPEGAVTGALEADAALGELAGLGARLGFVERVYEIPGRVTASAEFGGTRDAMVVPRLKVELVGAPADLAVAGSLQPDTGLEILIRAGGDIARLAEFARRNEWLTEELGVTGRVQAMANVRGPLDFVRVENMSAAVETQLGRVDLATGTMHGDGTLDLAGSVDLELDALWREAQRRELVEELYRTGGRLTGSFAVGGPRNQPLLRQARLRTVDAPITVSGDFVQPSAESIRAELTVTALLQALANVRADAAGTQRLTVPGEIRASIIAEGPLDGPTVDLPNFDFMSGAFQVSAEGRWSPDEGSKLELSGEGPLAEVANTLRGLQVMPEADFSGDLNLQASLREHEGRMRGRVESTVRELSVVEPAVAGAPLKEPELRLTATGIDWNRATGALAPVNLDLRTTGGRIQGTVELQPDGDASRVVTAGTVALDRKFATQYAPQLDGIAFDGVEGPFRFNGDVTDGRTHAAGWMGDAKLKLTGLTAPYVTISAAELDSAIREGVARVRATDAAVNGGTVTATADLGLVGEKPPHAFELDAKGVRIDGELAPLLSRASPLFAVGDAGSASGTVDAVASLTTKGLESEVIKRRLNGNGTVTVREGLVESRNWIAKLLSVVGKEGGRIQFRETPIPFTVENGKVRTSELPLDTGSLAMRLGGVAGLDGSLDYKLKVKPTAGGGDFEKYAKLLDPEGYLPLRLEGDLSDPDLKLPSVSDVIKDGIGGAIKDRLGGLFGGDDDEEDEAKDRELTEEERRKRRERRRRKREREQREREAKEAAENGTETPPPPPPPPGPSGG